MEQPRGRMRLNEQSQREDVTKRNSPKVRMQVNVPFSCILPLGLFHLIAPSLWGCSVYLHPPSKYLHRPFGAVLFNSILPLGLLHFIATPFGAVSFSCILPLGLFRLVVSSFPFKCTLPLGLFHLVASTLWGCSAQLHPPFGAVPFSSILPLGLFCLVASSLWVCSVYAPVSSSLVVTLHLRPLRSTDRVGVKPC